MDPRPDLYLGVRLLMTCHRGHCVLTMRPPGGYHHSMKTLIVMVVMLGLRVGSLQAQIPTLLSDTFTGNTVNSTDWQTLLPFGGSSVSQSGGFVTLADRGTLLSRALNNHLFVSGSLTMNSDLEVFNIAVCTDGSIPSGNTFADRTGIVFSFSNDTNQISIQRFGANGSTSILAQMPYTLTTGQSYNFTVQAQGPFQQFSINGTVLLTAHDSLVTGSQIALFGREGVGASSSIDFITVTGTPEPGTYAAIAGALVLGLAVWKKRRSVG